MASIRDQCPSTAKTNSGGHVDVLEKVLEKFTLEMRVLKPPFLQRGSKCSLPLRRENWKIVMAERELRDEEK